MKTRGTLLNDRGDAIALSAVELNSARLAVIRSEAAVDLPVQNLSLIKC